MTAFNLQLNGLTFGYRQALYYPLTLEAKQGEIIAVLGTNGKGKTTFLHTLIGVLPAISGSISYKGTIGFVPQSFSSPDYSTLDIVLMGRANQIGTFGLPTDNDRQVALNALTQLEIAHLANKNINRLSGGQRQLVLIASALATECNLLILDEPTASLDIYNQQRILSLMRKLAQQLNVTVLFSSHDPYHALCTADKVLLLQPQQQWQYGSIAQILTEPNLQQTYGMPIKHAVIEQTPVLIPLFKFND